MHSENKLGLRVLSQINDENAVISPNNLQSLFSMVYEGAGPGSQVAQELEAIAGIASDDRDRAKQIETRMGSDAVAHGEGIVLNTGHGVWVDSEYQLNQEFVATLEKQYGAEVSNDSFHQNSEEIIDAINQWVKRETNGKISKTLGPGSLNELTAMVMASVLYFSGDWKNPFPKELTETESFTRANGETVDVSMMRMGTAYLDQLSRPGENPHRRTRGSFSTAVKNVEVERMRKLKVHYAEIDGAQAIRLPYMGDTVSKMMILPPQGTSVRDLEQHLLDSPTALDSFRRYMQQAPVKSIKAPKYELEASYALQDISRAIGMGAMWTEAADFSRMTLHPGGFDAGLHKTYLRTDEKGSEGAAVSVARRTRSSPGKAIEISFDRPHLELITVDNIYSTTLFMNRIGNPQGK